MMPGSALHPVNYAVGAACGCCSSQTEQVNLDAELSRIWFVLAFNNTAAHCSTGAEDTVRATFAQECGVSSADVVFAHEREEPFSFWDDDDGEDSSTAVISAAVAATNARQLLQIQAQAPSRRR